MYYTVPSYLLIAYAILVVFNFNIIMYYVVKRWIIYYLYMHSFGHLNEVNVNESTKLILLELPKWKILTLSICTIHNSSTKSYHCCVLVVSKEHTCVADRKTNRHARSAELS